MRGRSQGYERGGASSLAPPLLPSSRLLPSHLPGSSPPLVSLAPPLSLSWLLSPSHLPGSSLLTSRLLSPFIPLAPLPLLSPWLGLLLPDFPRQTEFQDDEEEQPVEEPKEDENEQLGELDGRKQQRRKRAKGLSFIAEEVLDKFKKVSQLKCPLWP